MSTNLPRVVQKVFGENAIVDDAIAQFGSVIAGQPTFTGDIEEIQALNAWKNGWVGSTITDKRYPTSEETTGINKVITQQIAYLLQKGIPEWSAEETYYTNSFCQIDGTIYISLTDNNIGNIPTTSTGSWRAYEVNNSVTRSVGELTISPIPLIEAGLHLLDGALLDGNGAYSDFVSYIARRYNNDTDKIANVNLVGYIRESDGILSNFSADGYATLPNVFNPGTNSWEIVIKFTCTTNYGNQIILDINNGTLDYRPITMFVNNVGQIIYGLSNTTSSYSILQETAGSHTLVTGNDYWVKLVYTGTQYIGYISTDGIMFETDITVTSSTPILSGYRAVLGLFTRVNTAPLQGTIDLNESYINIGNSRWWSGMRTSWIVDEEVWQSSIATYGVCGKFVYNPTANTVRLPKITGIIEGTTDLRALGDLIEAGLPPITHYHGGTTAGAGNHQHYFGSTFSLTSYIGGTGNSQDWVRPQVGNTTTYTSWSGDHTHNFTTGNNSDVNVIYGKNSTVQPQTIKLLFYICIATETKTDVQIDIDEVMTDLNSKADTTLSNVPATITQIPPTSLINFDSKFYRKTQSLTRATAQGTYTLNLSSYLPNDNKNYYVLISGHFAGASSPSWAILSGSLFSALRLGHAQNGHWAQYHLWIPVGTDRILNYTLQTPIGSDNNMEVLGYARMGDNV